VIGRDRFRIKDRAGTFLQEGHMSSNDVLFLEQNFMLELFFHQACQRFFSVEDFLLD